MAELKTSYPGGKAGSGVYQTLINQIPPHDTYISATAGHDAVLRYKVPAARNVAIDEYYDTELIDWRSQDYFSVCRSGEKRRERIWMNYPEPIELHDYRFLGKDRRERERIKRQQATLRRKIEKLPPRERAAFIAVARGSE